MAAEVVFTRGVSVTELIERQLQGTTTSLEAALYRFNNPRLARALEDAARRGVRIRLLLDRNKYEESPAAREVLSNGRIPFRLLFGREGRGSKMHHKFVILDGRAVLTGSYNWTLESEHQNYENLLILRAPEEVEPYAREFEMLWATATEAGRR
jgi:phosphatidylserine/phosphatidylglycerophosphate/cardiolipin synthase-like enzyme